MKIHAIAPWFGAKRLLAAQILAESGRHAAYWEPFCGSLACLLTKKPCRIETVNDLHGDLIHLARTIQDPVEGPRLYRRLRRTWLAQELFLESAARLGEPFEPTPQRAYDFFVCNWSGRNGNSGTVKTGGIKSFCVRYTKNGGDAAKRFCSAVDSIPAWRNRLRHVTILRMDAFELLERIEDAQGCLIYCDPPYVEKGVRYVHDFEHDEHAQLAALLRRFRRARVLVSYYEHPLLEQFYAGWTKRRLVAHKALHRMWGHHHVTGPAPEVLLINGPSLVERGLF